MKNNNDTDETGVPYENDEENSMACQVRRKIEDYLERRRYQDELGDIGATE